jgi:hypothetical protein
MAELPDSTKFFFQYPVFALFDRDYLAAHNDPYGAIPFGMEQQGKFLPVSQMRIWRSGL